MTFGPDEVSELRSELLKVLGMSSDVSSIELLTVSPSKDLLAKRLPLKVVFVRAISWRCFRLLNFDSSRLEPNNFKSNPAIRLCRFA